jgi:hypothetical protein
MARRTAKITPRLRAYRWAGICEIDGEEIAFIEMK